MRGKGRWINVEVIDVYPTTLGHCPHFNLLAQEVHLAGAEFCPLSDQVLEYPRDVVESHRRVASYIEAIKRTLFGKGVNVRVEMIEATSPKGIIKLIRHRVKGQAAVIVNGKKVCEGNFKPSDVAEAVRREVETLLAERCGQ